MYLMAGAGTNVPELLTITKMIGKRASAMYFSMIVAPGFKPVLDFDRTSNTIKQANKLMIELPAWANWICSGIIIAYAVVALYRYLRRKMKKA